VSAPRPALGDGPPPVALFELDHVAVTAPDGTAMLRDVDLRIEAGRLTVLVGRSGSGKSTLLRLANRLEVPSAGTVSFRGQDVASLDPLSLRRRVGMVFQRPTPFPGTVRDNLLVAAPDATDPSMVEVLDRVGLDASFLDRVADELSGGEAQRTCLARTLLTDPEAVLMDEATSALDPVARSGVEVLARRLVADGLSVVWVTHDLRQAERLADHLVVLVDGQVAHGDTHDRYLASERSLEGEGEGNEGQADGRVGDQEPPG
jgi:putative ABC transport system ATP-binding protein